jgi:3-oxoadipate enol-lactonase
MWNPQMSLLTQHFKVLRFDTRGHGHSSAPTDPYSLEELAQDSYDVFKAL